MNQGNKGIKIVLAILVVVCIIQAVTIYSLKEDIEYLNNDIYNINARFSGLQSLVWELDEEDEESEEYEEEYSMDVAYNVAEMDWNKGEMRVDFFITPQSVTDNTRILIDDENKKTELTREGNSFTGSVWYPINSDGYDVSVYLYEGDYEKYGDYVEYISSESWATKVAFAEIDGYTSYGNDKLTIAGKLNYSLKTDEKIKNAKWVFGDTVTELGKDLEGSISVNDSEVVSKEIFDEEYEEELMALESYNIYVEFETEKGIIYRIHPAIYESAQYYTEDDSENIAYEGMSQDHALVVVMPDGTQYPMYCYE